MKELWTTIQVVFAGIGGWLGWFLGGCDGEAEFKLVNSGRHTYLYHPKSGEDYANVVNHLFEAGIIVLLILDKDAEIDDRLSSDEHYKTWDSISGQNSEHEVTSDEISDRIFKITNSAITLDTNNWII